MPHHAIYCSGRSKMQNRHFLAYTVCTMCRKRPLFDCMENKDSFGVPLSSYDPWRDMEPVFSHFPCHGDSFDLTVIRCHKLVTMYETIRGETLYYSLLLTFLKHFSTRYPRKLSSQAFVSSFDPKTKSFQNRFWKLPHDVPEHT